MENKQKKVYSVHACVQGEYDKLKKAVVPSDVENFQFEHNKFDKVCGRGFWVNNFQNSNKCKRAANQLLHEEEADDDDEKSSMTYFHFSNKILVKIC